MFRQFASVPAKLSVTGSAIARRSPETGTSLYPHFTILIDRYSGPSVMNNCVNLLLSGDNRGNIMVVVAIFAGGKRRITPLSQLEPLLTPEEINKAVERLAREITRDYRGRNPLLLGVLKGSFIFMADLVRNLDIPLELEFVSLSSYGPGRKESSGEVKIVQGLRIPVENRSILVVEDVVDTGITLTFLRNYLQERKPESVRICALFDKPSRRKVPVDVSYLGLTIPDTFVVGYGIDYDEKFRHLPGLYTIREPD